MNFNHRPVLLEECIHYLNISPAGKYIDGTLGGAGHSSEILKLLDEEGILIGLDQDIEAIDAANEKLSKIDSKAKFIIQHTNFENIRQILEIQKIKSVDGILLDLGVSSYQLEQEERGFSYWQDAPLDMRMDKRNKLTAEKIINTWEHGKLAQVIREYGEENFAGRIASFIVRERQQDPIKTTKEFAELITRAIPARTRRTGPHPARRTFQAIRIAVNDELGVLRRTLLEAVKCLNKNGRLCIITFHSLEDRIVKQAFIKQAKPCTCPPDFPQCACGKQPEIRIVTPKPVIPGDNEVEANPRSRSAKLRVAEKI